MWTRALVVLTGVIFISHQIFATDTYIAELMIQSNVTLDESTLLSTLTGTFTVKGNQQINIINTELVAACLLTGSETDCNCTEGYVWTNEVCYKYGCCNFSSCSANISHIDTSICIAKVKVRINGSAKSEEAWTNEQTVKQKLEDGLKTLNALEGVNITKWSSDPSIADFEAEFSVFFNTSRLQKAVTDLEASLKAIILVDTSGMVCIEYPEDTVLYEKDATFNCTFGEKTDSSGWILSRKDEWFELNLGSVVVSMDDCATMETPSCVEVTLKGVTGAWAGTYECGFTSGSVRHTARANLTVALLPDTITVSTDPLTVDCKEDRKVAVTAAIPNIKENLKTTWSYRGKDKGPVEPTKSNEDMIFYTVEQEIDCEERETPQSFSIFFENPQKQVKNGTVDIPVIYAGKKFCEEEKDEEGKLWPKTPYGSTVIDRECPEGRVGYRERTCDEGGKWKEVYSNCVNEELDKVKTAAENFLKGLGATNEVALVIFSGLLNSTMQSEAGSQPTDAMADLDASITILDSMAMASEKISLDESLFDGFLGAASNMLNQSWDTVNKSVEYSMSTKYLKSVEDLVKNIKVNNSEGFNTENLELKICRANGSADCNRTVFGVGVNLNKTSGIIKTMAMKNLVEKLPDRNSENIRASERNKLLVSATVANSTDSSIDITLAFPELTGEGKAHCVFWNTTTNEWSGEGCRLIAGVENFTLCRCNHLTSFSSLMSKNPVDLPFENEITYIGLGVSICSLSVFLVIEALVWSAVVKSNLSLFRHTAMVNISVCLLLALLSFLASIKPDSLSDSMCTVMAACKHFFFLAMFFWTLCLSTMLVHQLIFVFSPLRKRVFMLLSSIVGYVCPAVIVGVTYVYYRYTKEPYQKLCWLYYVALLKGSLHAFILPLGVIVLTNMFCMGVVILTLTKSSGTNGNASDKDTAKGILKVVVLLTPLFGVTWALGLLMLIFDLESHPWAVVIYYGFTILNSFQGFFIFLTGCLAEQKVREELFKLIMAKAPLKGKSESMKQLTTTTCTKER